MRSGRTYLYLQFYPAIKNKITGKSVEWESLHLEVFPGTRDKEKRQQDKFNRDVAYQIYMKRAMQIAAEDYDFADPFRRESDALAYFKELAEYKNIASLQSHEQLFPIRTKCLVRCLLFYDTDATVFLHPFHIGITSIVPFSQKDITNFCHRDCQFVYMCIRTHARNLRQRYEIFSV